MMCWLTRIIQKVIVFGVILLILSPLPQSISSTDATQLSIAKTTSEAMALIDTATKQNYFKSLNLSVQVKKTISDEESLQALFNKKAQVAIVQHNPLVHLSFERDDFVIIGTVFSSSNFLKVGTHNDAIQSVKDLKAQKIGITKLSPSHYFLSSLLVRNGMTTRNVRPKYSSIQDNIEKFKEGSLDAIVLSDSDLHNHPNLPIKKLISKKDMYFTTYNIVTLKSFAKEQPKPLTAFLSALNQATSTDMADLEHSIESKGNRNRSEHRIELTLNQNLLMIMEQEAKWLSGLDIEKRNKRPNYFDFINLHLLKEVNQEAVTIIH